MVCGAAGVPCVHVAHDVQQPRGGEQAANGRLSDADFCEGTAWSLLCSPAPQRQVAPGFPFSQSTWARSRAALQQERAVSGPCSQYESHYATPLISYGIRLCNF